MSRRVTLEMNPDAVKAANAAVGNRQLDPTAPADAADRKKWMDAYEAAAGSTQDTARGNEPITQVVQPCPPLCIDLEYLQCDGVGVSGAQYHVYSVDHSGKKDGFYEQQGTLDGDGRAHIDSVPDMVGFQYYFDKDPKAYEPKPVDRPTGEVKKAKAESIVDAAGSWIWGTLQGDFNKEPSLSQIAVNAALGLIPLVDQALDARDIIAGLKDLIDYYSEDDATQQKHEGVLGLDYETWLWVNVFIIAIGCIPSVGSAVKGVIKGVLHYLQRAGKEAAKLSPHQLREAWELLVAILNGTGVGNAHGWLKAFPGKLSGWMDDAAKRITSALKSLDGLIASIGKYAQILGGDTAKNVAKRADEYAKAIQRALGKLEAMKAKINAWIGEQVNNILPGSHKFEHRGTTGTSNYPVNNTRVQTQAEAPEVRLLDRNLPNTGDWRKTSRTGQPTTVLGRSPDGYAKKADEIGANKFEIPQEQWDKMSDAERWQANQEFLDDCIANNSDIQLVTNFNETQGYYFQKEKAYLLSKGYKPSPDGFSLIPPQ